MFKKLIPHFLLFSRIPAAILVVMFTYLHKCTGGYSIGIVGLIVYALIADIFDGILARKWNVSSVQFRVWDSSIDQFFWVTVVVCAAFWGKLFFNTHALPVSVVVVLEFLTYLISYLKFKKPIATHALLSKIWTLFLCGFLIEVFISGSSSFLFWCTIILGAISRLEIIAIIYTLPNWQNYIPNLSQAIALKKGMALKRNKWLNG